MRKFEVVKNCPFPVKLPKRSTAGSRGPEGYYIGNIVKYLYRYKWKNGIEDLKKAEEYLHLLIA